MRLVPKIAAIRRCSPLRESVAVTCAAGPPRDADQPIGYGAGQVIAGWITEIDGGGWGEEILDVRPEILQQPGTEREHQASEDRRPGE
jgi:hypothetical protein